MGPDRQAQPGECFEFTWRRREKGPGFRWIRGKQGQEILVGPRDEIIPPYEPLKEATGLFLTFAALDGSKESFVGFANAYGRLGTYHTLMPEIGEPLYEWKRNHVWMQFLVKLRGECCKTRPQLGQLVSWVRDQVVFHFPKINSSTETWRQRGQIQRCLQNRQGLPLFKPGDYVGPARWFLAYALQMWLRELDNLGRPIAARMVWSEEEQRARFVFSPNNLIGAMVCQFAAAIHGAWLFNECVYCHRFFRLAPGINRANRRTCSITCKQYLHNCRVKRARQLHGEGRSIREIANMLNVVQHGGRTAAQIVQTWVAEE